MNSIYSISSAPDDGRVSVEQVWTQSASNGLSAGYTSLVPVQLGEGIILVAYNSATLQTDVYRLTASDPWIQPANSQADLSGGPWDSIATFVLGNETYLLTYRRDTGDFGFFRVAGDLSVSKPYIFTLPRNTPTKGFTTIGPFTSLGQQYVLGYDFDTGTVANFSVTVAPASVGGVPPLLALNIWYHQWAKGWTHFAFFQLGGANFFFKINTAKLNVNIDHIQDNPSLGTVEVGSYLQAQLPNALIIDIVAAVPWANGEPYLLTYIASSGATAIYAIHANCQGWTCLNTSMCITDASQAAIYRIGSTSYALLYQK